MSKLKQAERMKKRFLLSLLCSSIISGSIAAQNPDRVPELSITLLKMQVLYVGVDNPVQISCIEIPRDSLNLFIEKGTVTKIGRGIYNVNVNSPGEVILTCSSLQYGKFHSFKRVLHCRAKRLPDPLPALGAKYTLSDTIETGLFKSQTEVRLMFPSLDFDAKCDMLEYKITQIGSKNTNAEMFTHTVINTGVSFSQEALALINKGKSGDIFIFSDIKGRCPGDVKSRKLNSLVFFLSDKK
ncbi:MAG: GldM family protein [Saprospiraceae bacterium]